jgi:hypothetical protein
MAYRLGKNPPVVDSRTIRFGAYLTPELAAPPVAQDYGAKVASWPMYGNDQYGDCTCAAAGHMIQSWTANAATEFSPTDESVLRFYEHFVGDPPPPDQGCDMLSVLNYWRSTGLDRRKITAFASIQLQNQTQAQNAIYLFGSLYIGVALPNFATQGDMLTVPWVVPSTGPVGDAAPNQDNGHCIPAVGYDATNLYIVTWGEVKSMSWGFYNAYADESFAVISKDFIGPAGTDPAGFNMAALEADLKQI